MRSNYCLLCSEWLLPAAHAVQVSAHALNLAKFCLVKLTGHLAKHPVILIKCTEIDRCPDIILTTVFDNPRRLESIPKYFEQMRRDALCRVPPNHHCDGMEATTNIPRRTWRANFLNCRLCKQNVVKFLSKYFLQHIGDSLQSQQSLYVAGAFDGSMQDTSLFVRGRS